MVSYICLQFRNNGPYYAYNVQLAENVKISAGPFAINGLNQRLGVSIEDIAI